MPKNIEKEINISTIDSVTFKCYVDGEDYPITNISKIIENEKEYLITSHGIDANFPKGCISINKFADAS